MATAKYFERGESLDYLSTADKPIEAGTIINLTTRIAIAGTRINPNEKGSIHVMGVFILPKTDTTEISQGALVYFDGNGITTTDSDTPAGYAAYDSKAGDSEIFVKLLG